jgi:hypothetical protein
MITNDGQVEILVTIDSEAFSVLRHSLSVAYMSGGLSTVSEQAMKKIMQAIEDGQEEVELRKRCEI